MLPEHYMMINAKYYPQVHILCTLQDEEGKSVPLADCSFKEYYNHYTWKFNEGLASPNYTYGYLHGQYHGQELQRGECGISLGGYVNGDIYILGCRVRPTEGVWQTAVMLLSAHCEFYQMSILLDHVDTCSRFCKDLLQTRTHT